MESSDKIRAASAQPRPQFVNIQRDLCSRGPGRVNAGPLNESGHFTNACTGVGLNGARCPTPSAHTTKQPRFLVVVRATTESR
jgi:hypothetical protein